MVLLVIGMLGLGFVQAQESINSAGNTITGSGGSVAYSIGQVVYTTNTGSSGSVVQGAQSAFEIYTLGIKETGWNISLTAFPNPTTANLTLQLSEHPNEELSYQLYDIQGKLLNSGQIAAQQTQIITTILPAATYFVNILNQENKKVQSFKIIKK